MTDSTTAYRRYANPPIEEALVEFRMVSPQEWDLTIPGKLHERVKASYPGKPRQQRLVQASVLAVRGQPPGISTQEGIGRIQLPDATGRRLISLGRDVLSVNVLRPYDGWGEFRKRIDEALKAYVEVSEAEGVGRIGVRYINKITIARPDVDLGEYFTCGPVVPDGLPNRVDSFVNQTEHRFDDDVRLLVTFASIGDGHRDESAFLLDLDVIWRGSPPLPPAAALDKLDELHEREGRAFEALITDATRELFGAI